MRVILCERCQAPLFFAYGSNGAWYLYCSAHHDFYPLPETFYESIGNPNQTRLIKVV